MPGGLGDTTQPHLPQPEFAFGAIVSGPEEMRRCVRMFVKYGVDTLKINLSGESITGMPSEIAPVHRRRDRDLRRGGQGLGQARRRARALDASRSSSASRHGIEVIYHASFTDEEALDLLEQHKIEHFVAPGLAWLINTCHHASAMGPDARGDEEDGLPPRARGARSRRMQAMRKRGIRILPGGDYGFAWTPHGTNAKDLEYFVKYVGMSTMEALLSATAWGGPMMKHGQASSATSARAASPTSC